jgi:hypothetical protein
MWIQYVDVQVQPHPLPGDRSQAAARSPAATGSLTTVPASIRRKPAGSRASSLAASASRALAR